MKEFTIEPGQHAATWMVKLEGVAPEKIFDKYDEAMEAGKKMAEQNKPSKLIIYNENKEKEDVLTFK